MSLTKIQPECEHHPQRADTRTGDLRSATSPEYVYMPSNGNDLKIAFRAIAQDINSLRISK